jgi:hypothetical protein
METNSMHARLLALAVMVLLAPMAMAGGEPVPVKRAPPTKPLPPVPEQAPPFESVSTASVPREVRRAVVADAARRFSVAENLVVVASAEKVTWNDASLGCPMPGMSYTQALVPGYRIVARSSAGAFIYHTDATGNLAVCDTQLPRLEHHDPKVAPKPVEPRAEPPPARTAPDR